MVQHVLIMYFLVLVIQEHRHLVIVNLEQVHVEVEVQQVVVVMGDVYVMQKSDLNRRK